MSLQKLIEDDVWVWFEAFLCAPSEFYGGKFPPCPYARSAIVGGTVDVLVWGEGDVRSFIRNGAIGMRAASKLTTRVMVFPPRVQWTWGLTAFVESLNDELASDNVFLNTGVAKTTKSRYPGSANDPYFMVVANSLDAVLDGSSSLQKTDYYARWPQEHYELVVERRARLAAKHARD